MNHVVYLIYGSVHLLTPYLVFFSPSYSPLVTISLYPLSICQPYYDKCQHCFIIFLWLIIFHHFFIHSPGGHLACFHVLAIVNSAAMNIGLHISVWIRVFVFSEYIPRTEIDHTVTLCLAFWGTSILFSRVTAPICIPTNSVQGFLFLHSLFTIYYL